jgi:hypothetical protein
MARKCWTCNTEHDLDAACGASPAVRAIRAAGGPGHELDDTTALFDEPEERELGPVFTAVYDGEDACCGEGIEEGQQARADGEGGWIHANGRCDA